jgi:hypothetical protein
VFGKEKVYKNELILCSHTICLLKEKHGKEFSFSEIENVHFERAERLSCWEISKEFLLPFLE